MLPHPPLDTLAKIYNWCVDAFSDDVVIIADDDIVKLVSFTCISVKAYRDPIVIYQVLENAAECDREIGAHLFGFTQDGGVFGYWPQDPIAFTGWLATVFGVIGRTWRYDERFHFYSVDRLRSHGGVGANRSLERELADSELLQRKWGQYVSIGFKATGTRYKSIHVQRRQAKT